MSWRPQTCVPAGLLAVSYRYPYHFSLSGIRGCWYGKNSVLSESPRVHNKEKEKKDYG